jgi:hypothetical protein
LLFLDGELSAGPAPAPALLDDAMASRAAIKTGGLRTLFLKVEAAATPTAFYMTLKASHLPGFEANHSTIHASASLFYPPNQRSFRGKTSDREDMVNVRFHRADAASQDRRSRQLSWTPKTRQMAKVEPCP